MTKGMRRDMWQTGDWFVRMMVILIGLLAVALVWAIMEDAREREQLHDDGCVVVDSRTEYVMTPVMVGKVVVMQMHPRTVETWRCEDREFER